MIIKKLLATAMTVAVVLSCGSALMADSSIKIDAAHFPDANFRAWIKENPGVNSDDWLTPAEISSIIAVTDSAPIDPQTHKRISNAATFESTMRAVKSIDGIKYLTSVKSVSINEGDIESVDLSNIYTINEASFFYCAELTSVKAAPNETILQIMGCDYLTDVNLFSADRLDYFVISHCRSVSSLNFKKNRYLNYVYIEYMPKLSTITLKSNDCLKHLEILDASLENIDLTECFDLQYLRMSGTKVKNIDLSECKWIKSVYLHRSGADNIYIGWNTSLYNLIFGYKNVSHPTDIYGQKYIVYSSSKCTFEFDIKTDVWVV